MGGMVSIVHPHPENRLIIHVDRQIEIAQKEEFRDEIDVEAMQGELWSLRAI